MSKTTLSEKKKQAIAYHDRGFNCAQSVACVFTEKTGLDEETLFKVTEGLGLGMGCKDGTCGAISAAAVLSGLTCSTGHTNHPDSKTISYEKSSSCIHAFEERNRSIVCRELRGEDTGIPLRSCPGCIEDAVEIIEEQLFSGK